MERVKQQIVKWAQDDAPASPAARAAGVIAIVVIPGAWAVWLAWRLIRSRVVAA
ncbi:MAG TPA: hypothetical protein VLD36_22210 [Burkholderiales bacterium]|jgi:hypothetical protein|nr:hypothetical protein [Burkholderiales bacterium]